MPVFEMRQEAEVFARQRGRRCPALKRAPLKAAAVGSKWGSVARADRQSRLQGRPPAGLRPGVSSPDTGHRAGQNTRGSRCRTRAATALLGAEGKYEASSNGPGPLFLCPPFLTPSALTSATLSRKKVRRRLVVSLPPRGKQRLFGPT